MIRRREFLRGGAGLAAGALGAGCGVGPQSAPKPVATKVVPPKIDGDLLIFNWTEYMNPKVIKRFEKTLRRQGGRSRTSTRCRA